MPLGEEITGMPSLCANSVSSLPASDSVTPWPMNSTGRCGLQDHVERAR